MDPDDVAQSGYLAAVVDARHSHDPVLCGGLRFRARKGIQEECNRLFSVMSKQNRRVPVGYLSMYDDLDDDEKPHPPDLLCVEHESYNDCLLWVDTLTPLQQRIVDLRVEGYLLKEIGELINLCESRVCQIMSVIRGKFRWQFKL